MENFAAAVVALAAWTAILVLFNIPMVLLARRYRVPVEEFSVYFGRALARFRVGRTLVRINWIPLGGYVKFKGIRQPDDDPSSIGDDEVTFAEVHPLRRALIAISGPVVLLALGGCLLGPSRTYAFFASLPANLLHAINEGGVIGTLRAFFSGFGDPSMVIRRTGELALFFGTINMLPVPIVSGGIALMYVGWWLK